MLITVNGKIKNNKSNLSHSKTINLNYMFVQHIKRHFDGDQPNVCLCIAYTTAIGPCRISDRCGIISFAETFPGFHGSGNWLIPIFCTFDRCLCFWKGGSFSLYSPYCVPVVLALIYIFRRHVVGFCQDDLGITVYTGICLSGTCGKFYGSFPFCLTLLCPTLTNNVLLLADKWHLGLLWSHLASV